MKWSKRLPAFLLVLLFALCLAGCGANKDAISEGSADTQSLYNGNDALWGEETAGEDPGETESTESEDTSGISRSGDKLIYTAEVNAEATDFDAAVASLSALVDTMGGYFESSQVYLGSTGSSYRWSYYVIRIPSENYRTFLSRLEENGACHMTNLCENVEDVTESYYDIQNRLTTQQTKLTRLQELLSQAESVEDIITIESEISEVEYLIDYYTGILNSYDSQVAYSTVTLNLDQVTRLTEESDTTLVSRMGASFRGGLNNFVDGCQSLLVWMAGNVLIILLLAVIVAAVIVILRRRSVKKRRAVRPASTEPKEE